ncbi:MAG: hypothetical protein ACJ72E_12240, partial [Marmoricola sp.]
MSSFCSPRQVGVGLGVGVGVGEDGRVGEDVGPGFGCEVVRVGLEVGFFVALLAGVVEVLGDAVLRGFERAVCATGGSTTVTGAGVPVGVEVGVDPLRVWAEGLVGSSPPPDRLMPRAIAAATA